MYPQHILTHEIIIILLQHQIVKKQITYYTFLLYIYFFFLTFKKSLNYLFGFSSYQFINHQLILKVNIFHSIMSLKKVKILDIIQIFHIMLMINHIIYILDYNTTHQTPFNEWMLKRNYSSKTKKNPQFFFPSIIQFIVIKRFS